MIFNTLRILLWLTISSIVVLRIRKTKIVRKRLFTILTVVLCLGLISVSGMFPVENLFINFKSPESVFNYAKSGRIDDIVYGKGSCMVLYSKGNNSGGYFIIPKSGNGYKIPNYFATQKISHKFDSNGNYDVYRVRGTNDYYICGMTVSKENEINIVDSNNNEVKNTVIRNGNADTKTIILYAFVENFTNKYFILINSKKISIS